MGVGIFDRLRAMAALGAGELRGAYLERKQEIGARARVKRQQAKGRIARVKVKADEAKEMAELEAAMYQAQIDAQSAQDKARELRRRAGHYTVGEKISRFVGGTGAAGQIIRGLGRVGAGIVDTSEPRSRKRAMGRSGTRKSGVKQETTSKRRVAPRKGKTKTKRKTVGKCRGGR